MPRRDPFEKNQYYHIYNRGLNKQTLFFDLKDFERFLWHISLQKEKYKESVGLIAYCLLPNHFHFVLYNKEEGFSISDFVGKLSASYSKYLWIKYGREKGVKIFEGRFKSKVLDSERYLQQCIKYVEHNAIKHGLTKNVDERAFTSYDKNKSIDKIDVFALDREF